MTFNFVNYFDSRLLHKEFKLVGGTQRVSVNIALKLGESCVHTDTAVSRIEQMEDGVVVTSGNGTQYRVGIQWPALAFGLYALM